MKFINKITLLALLLALFCINDLITSKLFSIRKSYLKRKSTKYGSKSLLDFFTNKVDIFPGYYVYDFDNEGKFVAINKGNPEPIRDDEKHRELGRGGFGRVAIVSGPIEETETLKEIIRGSFAKVQTVKRTAGFGNQFIVKLNDVNENSVRNGDAKKTIEKSISLIAEQKREGKSEYVMKYYAAKTYNCFKYYQCAALLLEKINGEELFKLISEDKNIIENASLSQVANLFYTLIVGTLDFYNRYGRYHYDIKPENFMITKLDSQCWFGKMIDIDGSLNQQEMKTEYGTSTPIYRHPDFTTYDDNRKPFLSQDKYALGATLFEILKIGMGYDEDYFAGCSLKKDGAFGCVAEKLVLEQLEKDEKDRSFYPIGISNEQFEVLLNSILALLNGEDLFGIASSIKKAFPEIILCKNPEPKYPNRLPPIEDLVPKKKIQPIKKANLHKPSKYSNLVSGLNDFIIPKKEIQLFKQPDLKPLVNNIPPSPLAIKSNFGLSNFDYLSKEIMSYNDIQECKEISTNEDVIKTKYGKSSKLDGCIDLEISDYLTNYFKPINCFLRTDLKNVVNTSILDTHISLIQLTLSFSKSKFALAQDQKVYKEIQIDNSVKLEVGDFFKNRSFLITSTAKIPKPVLKDSNRFILSLVPIKGKNLYGKDVGSCSLNPFTALLARGLCWKVTKINTIKRKITMQNIECNSKIINYGDI